MAELAKKKALSDNLESRDTAAVALKDKLQGLEKKMEQRKVIWRRTCYKTMAVLRFDCYAG